MKKLYKFLKYAYFLLFISVVGVSWGQLNEGFESTSPPPSGWTYTSVTHGTNNPRNGTRCATFNANNDEIISPLISNPNQLSFWWRRSGTSPGSPIFQVFRGTSTSGPWTQIGTDITSFTTTYQEFTFNLSAFSNIYIRILHTRTSGANEVYIDDFSVSSITSSCTPPTVSATGLNTTVTTNTINLAWSNPPSGADGVIVVARSVSGVNQNPSSGTAYAQSSIYGNGANLTNGNFVVYTGTGNNVSITGLSPSTVHNFAIYTYTNTGLCYNTTNVLTGTGTTNAAPCSTPTEATSFAATSGANLSSVISWTNPTCFDEVLIVASANGSVSGTPTGDGSAYTSNLNFGSGTAFGGGFIVYKGSSSSQTVTNLINGTEYFFKVFARKGTNWSTGVEVFATPNNGVVYYSRGSGLHTASIWSTSRSGTSSSAILSSTNSLVIQSGHLIELAFSGVDILHLTIENGGRIYRNDATTANMRYINLFGNIICNGVFGTTTAAFDAIGINVEGINCSVAGAGNFNPARIRKSSTANVNSTFTFGTNTILPFPGTCLYNNVNGGNLYFNINPNIVVVAKGDGVTSGDVSLDGVSGTAGERSGGYTISGILSVAGTSYLVTDNNASQTINYQINNNGKLFTNNLDLSPSNSSGHSLTIKNGGQLTVNNSISNFSNTNNIFTFESGSTFEYAGGGQVIQPSLPYSNLLLSGSGNKTLASNLIVNNNLSITGIAVLPATTNTLTVSGNWHQTNTSNFTSSAATIVLNGGSATINAQGESFENLIVNSSGIKTLLSDLNCTQNVSILGGTLDVSTYTLNGGGALSMIGGNLRIAKTGVSLPELTGSYNLAGGSIELYGNGSQSLKGTPTYNNLIFSNNSITTLTSSISLNANAGVLIQNNAILNVENNSFGGSNNPLTMTGTSKFMVAGSNTKPDLADLYNLSSGTTIEFYGSASTTSIRQGPSTGGSQPHKYQNLIFSGVSTITAPANVLMVEGNFTNNLTTGIFKHNSGTISLTGSNQTISGTSVTDFYKLNLDGSGTKTFADSVRVLHTLSITSPVNINISNKALTFVSDQSYTARLGIVPSGSVISGNMNMQRFVPAKKAYRFFSTAVQGNNLTKLKNDIFLTNLTNDRGFDVSSRPIPSVYWYVESITGGLNSGWRYASTITSNLVVGRGYNIFVKGSRADDINSSNSSAITASGSNVVINSIGTPNYGDINLNPTFTNSAGITADGWNLVGNPYASEIDWDNVSGWTKNNIEETITLYDPGTTNTTLTGTIGKYVSYKNGVASDGSSNRNIIASSQAFWIKATSVGSNLIVKESAKTEATHYANFRDSYSRKLISLKVLNKNGDYDISVIRLESDASVYYDSKYDANKFKNSGLNIFTKTPYGEHLGINAITVIDSVEISFDVNPKTDSLKISLSEQPNYQYFLIDKYKGKIQNLTNEITIDFDNSVESKSDGRFKLLIKRNALVEQTTDDSVIISDSTLQLSENGTENVQEIEQVTSSSADLLSIIQIYPNPVEGEILNMEIGNSKSEKIFTSITNQYGQILMSKTFNNNSKNVLSLEAFEAGVYFLQLSTNEEKKVIKLVIK